MDNKMDEEEINNVEDNAEFENEIENDSDNNELTAADAFAAMVDDNYLAFNEIMAELIKSRAADYVNATRDVLLQQGFNLNDQNANEDEELEEEPIDTVEQ